MALHRASPTVAVCEMLRMDSERAKRAAQDRRGRCVAPRAFVAAEALVLIVVLVVVL
jgi:chorismate synthase